MNLYLGTVPLSFYSASTCGPDHIYIGTQTLGLLGLSVVICKLLLLFWRLCLGAADSLLLNFKATYYDHLRSFSIDIGSIRTSVVPVSGLYLTELHKDSMCSWRCTPNGKSLCLEEWVLTPLKILVFINILRSLSHGILKGFSSFGPGGSSTLKAILLLCL